MTGELGLEDIGILAFCRGELCVEWVVSFKWLQKRHFLHSYARSAELAWACIDDKLL